MRIDEISSCMGRSAMVSPFLHESQYQLMGIPLLIVRTAPVGPIKKED